MIFVFVELTDRYQKEGLLGNTKLIAQPFAFALRQGAEPGGIQPFAGNLIQMPAALKPEFSGTAVILLIDDNQDIGVPCKLLFHRIIHQLVYRRCPFVKMEAMRGIHHNHPLLAAQLPGQTAKQSAHRRMTVNGLDMITPDQLKDLPQCLFIVGKQERRSGDGNRMNLYTESFQFFLVNRIVRLLHIGGIMHFKPLVLQDLYIALLKLSQKVPRGGQKQNTLFYHGRIPPGTAYRPTSDVYRKRSPVHFHPLPSVLCGRPLKSTLG